MEDAAARNLFFHTNCLEQSLVLWWLLRRRGIAADLRIGARKDSDRFEAHAWVEFDSASAERRGRRASPFRSFREADSFHGGAHRVSGIVGMYDRSGAPVDRDAVAGPRPFSFLLWPDGA